MIDRYDRVTFEAALPVDKRTGAPLWESLGLELGEHVYRVPVKPGVLIHIRSTIRADGLAAETAQDSIRCWLADASGIALGSKHVRWISRVVGWDRRMTETLRALWRLGAQLNACPKCGVQLAAFRVTKNGPNKGRWFAGCRSCVDGFHKWLREEPEKKGVAA